MLEQAALEIGVELVFHVPRQRSILGSASIPKAIATYRKHVNGDWQAFIVDSGNALYSAPGGNGACPAPGDASYVTGLNEGDACVQLKLTDAAQTMPTALRTVSSAIRAVWPCRSR